MLDVTTESCPANVIIVPPTSGRAGINGTFQPRSGALQSHWMVQKLMVIPKSITIVQYFKVVQVLRSFQKLSELLKLPEFPYQGATKLMALFGTPDRL